MKKHIVLRDHDSSPVLKKVIKHSRDSATQLRIKAILLRKQGRTPQQIAKQFIYGN